MKKYISAAAALAATCAILLSSCANIVAEQTDTVQATSTAITTSEPDSTSSATSTTTSSASSDASDTKPQLPDKQPDKQPEKQPEETKVFQLADKPYNDTVVQDGKTLMKVGIVVPTLSSDISPDAAETINSALNAKYEDLSQEATLMAGDVTPEMVGDAPFEYTTTYEVKCNDEKFFSVLFFTQSFTGGTHGNSASVAMTFDAETGKELSLEDIFADPTEIETLYGKVIAALDELQASDPEQFMYYDDYANTINIMVQDKTYEGAWYVDGANLTAFFTVYTIGPYAAGEYSRTFPFSDFKMK